MKNKIPSHHVNDAQRLHALGHQGDDLPATETKVPAHLQVDDYEPAGFSRIERQRPSKRPPGAERVREETRRRPRDGKW
jgi:hypothetical protein